VVYMIYEILLCIKQIGVADTRKGTSCFALLYSSVTPVSGVDRAQHEFFWSQNNCKTNAKFCLLYEHMYYSM